MAQEKLWEGLKETKEGDLEDTMIAELVEGVLGDFKPENYFKKADDAEALKKRKVVHVVCENGATLDIFKPEKTFGPKSILAAWMKTYRKFPALGDKVVTERDENGFWRIQLKMLR